MAFSNLSRVAIAIRESGKSHADNTAQDDEKAKSDDEDEQEEDQDEEEEEDYDPTKGAYFTLKSDGQQNGIWLNKDIFTVRTRDTKSKLPRQVFFSIAKRDVIGWIDDDIDEVFMSGNKIVAFTQSGDLYRVTLDEEEEVEDDQDEEKKVDTEDVPEKKDDTSGVNNKKRKASEMEDDESEALQSPKKKMKV
jgi:ribosomal protein L12E/L44/L45/RPP1/RPP2